MAPTEKQRLDLGRCPRCNQATATSTIDKYNLTQTVECSRGACAYFMVWDLLVRAAQQRERLRLEKIEAICNV